MEFLKLLKTATSTLSDQIEKGEAMLKESEILQISKEFFFSNQFCIAHSKYKCESCEQKRKRKISSWNKSRCQKRIAKSIQDSEGI